MTREQVACLAGKNIESETRIGFMGSHRIEWNDSVTVWLQFNNDKLQSYSMSRVNVFPPLSYETTPRLDICNNIAFYRLRIAKSRDLGEFVAYLNGKPISPISESPYIFEVPGGSHEMTFSFHGMSITKKLDLSGSGNDGDVQVSLSPDNASGENDHNL